MPRLRRKGPCLWTVPRRETSRATRHSLSRVNPDRPDDRSKIRRRTDRRLLLSRLPGNRRQTPAQNLGAGSTAHAGAAYRVGGRAREELDPRLRALISESTPHNRRLRPLRVVNQMARKTRKRKKGKAKREPRKSSPPRRVERTSPQERAFKVPSKSPIIPSVPASTYRAQPAVLPHDHPVFSIKIGSINGETTIGDLIVAFPRTRDVLMKHGLRFDVEDAGYLYMTLNIFSAIHGLAAGSLVQELHNVSLQPPLQPPSQQLRTVTAVPSV